MFCMSSSVPNQFNNFLCGVHMGQVYWKCCDWKVRVASAKSFTLWQKATIEITWWYHSIIACSCHIYMWCYSLCTSRLWWIAHSMQCQPRGCENIPSFLQRTAPIACAFCESCTWHGLHILVTAPFYCDQKALMASAQSFTLWQQATIEIIQRDFSVIAYSHHIYMVLFFTHTLFVVNCTFNTMPTGRLQQKTIFLKFRK